MKYENYNDYELVDMIAENNEDATNIMYEKYKPLIYASARRMIRYSKNTGLELNDLVQEGMIGLTNAIQNFSESKENLFYTYAKLCIERKMISAIVSSNRQKHRILNESLSIEKDYSDGNILANFLGDDTINPEKLLIHQENTEEIIKKLIENFTELEKQVFELKLNGFDYKEIAEILEKDLKSIDNTLQRVKFKMKKYLEDKS